MTLNVIFNPAPRLVALGPVTGAGRGDYMEVIMSDPKYILDWSEDDRTREYLNGPGREEDYPAWEEDYDMEQYYEEKGK